MKWLTFFMLFILLSCADKPENDNQNSSDFQMRTAGKYLNVEVSDSLVSYILESDTEIQGFLFQAGTPVGFFPSGKLRFGVLAEDSFAEGNFISAGSFVEFDEEGQIISR